MFSEILDHDLISDLDTEDDAFYGDDDFGGMVEGVIKITLDHNDKGVFSIYCDYDHPDFDDYHTDNIYDGQIVLDEWIEKLERDGYYVDVIDNW